MRRLGIPRLLPSLAAALVLAACQAAGAPSPADQATLSARPSNAPSPAQTATPIPSVMLTTPGLPYSAADLLAAMRDSRRPGGVPDEVKTDAIAAGIAAELWTWDGDPWGALSIGGTCGPASCSVEVTGSSEGRTDLYTFDVDATSGSVSIGQADLHAYPEGVDTQLDALVRARVDASRLEGMALVGGAWLRPPEAGRYLLPYRSGGEEGSAGLDILVDLAGAEVLSITEAG